MGLTNKIGQKLKLNQIALQKKAGAA